MKIIKVLEWMTKRKSNKYTSAEIQNEVLKVMAIQLLETVAKNIQSSSFYTVMVDETTDCANHEQVVICLRWVDDCFDVHEDFIGVYAVENICSDSLVQVIKDVLLRMNLALSKMRGQCYDGASAMAGSKSGVAKKLSDDEPKAIYTHCYGHALNLACSDAIKQIKILKDALDITYEVTKLIKMSPRRESIIQRLKQTMAPDSPGMRLLCPTRWTVKADSLKSVLDNYETLMETWNESVEVLKDTEMKARVLGVLSQMKRFDYFFGVLLGEVILSHSDNLSRTLQKRDISAAEGQEIAELTVKTLESIRSDIKFELFWKKAEPCISF